jgi:hypothetical protein
MSLSFLCVLGVSVVQCFAFCGDSRVSPQQQIAPVYPPLFRQRGGAPRASRCALAHILAHSAALPVLPAGTFGDNSAKFANFSPLCEAVSPMSLSCSLADDDADDNLRADFIRRRLSEKWLNFAEARSGGMLKYEP